MKKSFFDRQNEIYFWAGILEIEMNKSNEYKKELGKQFKSYLITHGSFLIMGIFLFTKISLNLLIFIIWLSFLTPAIMMIIRKEDPKLPPFKSITGRAAVVRGYISYFLIRHWFTLFFF